MHMQSEDSIFSLHFDWNMILQIYLKQVCKYLDIVLQKHFSWAQLLLVNLVS